MQTNGTLIDESIAKVFKENNIFVAVSIDGPKVVNDLHRVTHNGKSTYEDTMNGIQIMKNKVPRAFWNIICSRY